MRILLTPQSLPPVLGGSEFHALRVAQALADEGHEVRTLASNLQQALEATNPGRRFGPPLERIGRHDIVRLRYGGRLARLLLGTPYLPWPGRGRVRRHVRRRWRRDLERHVEAALEDFAPDVVITMPFVLEAVRATFRVRRRRRFPLVYVPLLHVEEPEARSAEIRSYLEGADAIITNTAFEKRWLCSELGIDPQHVFVGLLGTGRQDAPPQAPEHVLFLGRLVPSKGIGHLVRAMGRLREAGRDHRLVLAGARGPSTPEVDALLAGLPASERTRIEVRENVDEATKSALLRKASCLVLPSRSESFGLVLLEAWAHGVPVVTWDMPLFRDIVDHEQDGLLARLEDDEDLARCIQAFAGDPDHRQRAGARGREKVRTRYRWSDVAKRYVEACIHARVRRREKSSRS